MPIAKVVYHAREGTPHPSVHATQLSNFKLKMLSTGARTGGTSAALLLKKKKKKKMLSTVFTIWTCENKGILRTNHAPC